MKQKIILLFFFLMLLSLSVFVSATEIISCSDTDGGFNPNIKGTYRHCFSDGWCLIGRRDGCLNSSTLREGYCDGNISKSTYVFCPDGCENGVCLGEYILPQPPYCSDSDGGADYFTKGVVLGYWISYPKGDILRKEDSCFEGKRANLQEFICVDRDGKSGMVLREYNCTYGCENGACKRQPDPCSESWVCTNWSSCTNDLQTRTCIDFNNCGDADNKPDVTKNCTIQQHEQDENGQEIAALSKLHIQNKDVSVERNIAGKNIISIAGESVKTSLDVIEEAEKIYIKTSEGNKEMRILSEEAISKAQEVDTVEEVMIEEEQGKAVYSVSGTKKARLFLIIPVLAKVEQKINIEDGSVVSTKKPWWHFLALGI